MKIFERKRVYGVDFSGAKDAGRKIWIATGLIRGKRLELTDCRPAEELPSSGRERQRCLFALVDFISRQREAIFGMDFPFSLPESLVKEKIWKDFVLSFRKHFPNPQQFRKICSEVNNGIEKKRLTDQEQKTPFCCYNLRLYKQTYYGIQEVIEPLVREGQACFLPMQKLVSQKSWVMEICPAVTLKKEDLYFTYKGKTSEHYESRMRILKKLEEISSLKISKSLKARILDNSNGDALDSVVAAFAAFRNLPNLFSLPTTNKNSIYALEGYVYA